MIHEEFGSKLGGAGLIIALSSLIYAVVEGLLGFPNDALGILVGIVGVTAGLTMWSVNRYSRVVLTSEYLRVGNEKLSRRDVDSLFGVKDAETLTDRELRWVESPFPIPKTASVRIPGGAFGRISGTNVVVLRASADNKKLAFFSRRADELSAKLRTWMATDSEN